MYVDGFVLVVSKKKLKAYQRMAEAAGKLWMKQGALQYVESVGEDLHHGGMKIRTFMQLAKPKKGEAIVFSWILYKSKAHRNQVNARVMKDPSMSPEKMKKTPMPFDVTKMAYAGFVTLVNKKR
ncbi:MAG TPA: DUF1428 domain-containing protein [Candidatus Nanoarchaeia archaeon]|nr:DUF1428 domain-containing protein [Candidatus Nanoarchaeia archaeon]